MLQGAAFKLLTPQDTLRIKRGRCLRHRLSSSGCRNCFEVCACAALSWTETGLHWDQEKCSGCLLCAASCPTDALTGTETALGDLLQRLDEVDTPLLACSFHPRTQGHARVPCLGLIADPELLLVLQLALGKELRLNASACADCKNMRILPRLKHAVQQTQELASGLPGSVQLVAARDRLDYREKTCSRREFFGFLKHRSRQTGLSLVNRLNVETAAQSYGKKTLPLSRHLLLQLGKELPEARARIDTRILSQLTFLEECNGCRACIGVCPTGALLSPVERGASPTVVKDRCISCALCVEFCRQSAVKLSAV